MKPDFEHTEFAETSFAPTARQRKPKRRGRLVLGVLLLLAGYMSLAVTVDADTGWLWLRVLTGFVLLAGGLVLLIAPLASLFSRDRN